MIQRRRLNPAPLAPSGGKAVANSTSAGDLKIAVVGLGFGAEFVPIYRDHPDICVFRVMAGSDFGG